jgi:hypothetical protein
MQTVGMIKILVSFLFAVALLGAGCGNKKANITADAVNYNHKLFGPLSLFVAANKGFHKILNENDTSNYDFMLQNCINTCDSCVAIVKKVGPFYKDESFQLAVFKYFGALKNLYANDWAEAVHLRKTLLAEGFDGSAYSIAYTRLMKLADQIDQKFNKYVADVEVAQIAFAKKYKFTIGNGPSLLPKHEPTYTEPADEPMKEQAGE